MKGYFNKHYIVFLLFSFLLVGLLYFNHSDRDKLYNHLQEKIITIEKQADTLTTESSYNDFVFIKVKGREAKGSSGILYENRDKDKILRLKDKSGFITLNTGWYLYITKTSLDNSSRQIILIPFKQTYKIHNQYLKDKYAEWLNISEQCKIVQVSDTINEAENQYNFKDINGYSLPLKVTDVPAYKSLWNLNLATLLYIFLYVYLFYILLNCLVNPLYQIITLVVFVVSRYLFLQLKFPAFIFDSSLYDVSIYANPGIFFIQYIGEILFSVLLLFILVFKLINGRLHANKIGLILYIIILIGLLFLITNSFSENAAYSLNISDILFTTSVERIFSVLSIVILMAVIAAIAYLFTCLIKINFHWVFMIVSILLLLSVSYLLYQKQIINREKNIDVLRNTIIEKEQILLLDECQKISDNYAQIANKSFDSLQIINIAKAVEANSIYLHYHTLQVYDNYLLVKNKLNTFKKIIPDIFYLSDKEGQKIIYTSTYNNKYLFVEFAFSMPFYMQRSYPFMAEQIFQLPYVFKHLNVGVYHQDNLYYFIGHIEFPKLLNDTSFVRKYFEGYQYKVYSDNESSVIISSKDKTKKDILTLFSTLFITYFGLLMLLIYLRFVIKYKTIIPYKNTPFDIKITGAISAVIFSSFFLLVYFSYRQIQIKSKNDVSKKLIDNIQKMENGINTDFDNAVYNEFGILKSTNFSKVFQLGLKPAIVPADVMQNIKNTKIIFKKNKIGKFYYTSLYALLSKKHVIVEIPFYDENYFLETELNEFMSTLINVYALIFLISFFVGLIITTYLIAPINAISKYLSEANNIEMLKPITVESNDEIGTLVKMYNQLIDRLKNTIDELKKEQQAKAWKVMAQQIAHDIKNTLTPLQLNLQYLQMISDKNDEKKEKLFQSLFTQIAVLSKTADDFSSFSKEIVQSTKFNWNEFLNDVLLQYKQYSKINLMIQNSVSDYFLIESDKVLLTRVINNLISNAIDSMEDVAEEIIVTSSDTDGLICLSIKDTGCGIPKEIQDKIFEPHFTTKTSGKGLGLSIVKNICDKLNIQISFLSVENKGTTFSLKIPKNLN